MKNQLAFPPRKQDLATERFCSSPQNCSNFNFVEFVCKCQHLTAA